MTDDVKSRLDRIARDQSRTFFHGTRHQDKDAAWRPQAVLGGQEMRIDLPAADAPLLFVFTAGGAAPATVTIGHGDAVNSQAGMETVFTEADYFKLAIDPDIPTWVFSQKCFGFQNPPHAEDSASWDKPAANSGLVLNAPLAALIEVAPAGSPVTLLRVDTQSKTSTEVDKTKWAPAILVRFPLRPLAPGASAAPVGYKAFEIQGANQGDRVYLDLLGLLGSASAQNMVLDLSLRVQKGAQATGTMISDWAFVRTDLTNQSRPGAQALSLPAAAEPPAPFPFIAISDGTSASNCDAIALLQMASITNSGGYFLCAATNSADVDTLTLCVILTQGATQPGNSVLFPRAANALFLAADTELSKINNIRFDGLANVAIAPMTPPATALFGWTRSEPDVTATSSVADQYGYGTLSILDYSVTGADGRILLANDMAKAISPQADLPGDHHRAPQAAPADQGPQPESVALQVGPGKVAAQAETKGTLRRFRATLDVGTLPGAKKVDDASIYTLFADPVYRTLVLSPSFRDVFGNRFDASVLPQGAVLPKYSWSFTYTDAIFAPEEWPGVHLWVYPVSQKAGVALGLTMEYVSLKPASLPDPSNPGYATAKRKWDQYLAQSPRRITRLMQIIAQLVGVDGDVKASFTASPLVPNDQEITQGLIAGLKRFVAAEQGGIAAYPVELGSFPCVALVGGMAQLLPLLKVTRSRYLPGPTNLPSGLASQIEGLIATAQSTIPVTAAPATANQDFRVIAGAFQKALSERLTLQVGILRDRFNQHELWLIPDALFPSAVNDSWSFASPRPLHNTLGTETFSLPNFAAASYENGQLSLPPLETKTTAVDQDFDFLGRTAFRIIEQVSTDLSLVGVKGDSGQTRMLLAARETIANRLASQAFLVPLYQNETSVDWTAALRVARDAFLSDLNAFYSTGTVVQLPIQFPPLEGPSQISCFDGRVSVKDWQGRSDAPKLSDILLAPDDSKLTFLYETLTDPTASNAPKNFPAITNLSVTFSHVQRVDTATDTRLKDAFRIGPWIELVEPKSISWTTASALSIPIVDRRFPAKPVIGNTSPTVATSLTSLQPPYTINATAAAKLVKWGWRTEVLLADQGPNDTLHARVDYNVFPPPTQSPEMEMIAASAAWSAQSLLNSLFAFQAAPQLSASLRLPVVAALTSNLAEWLPTQATVSSFALPRAALPTPKCSRNTFIVGRDGTVGPVSAADGSALIMTKIAARSAARGTVSLAADADDPGNTAKLTGHNFVHNFQMRFMVMRNETLGTGGNTTPVTAALVYSSPEVLSPKVYWASNLFTPPGFTYVLAGQPPGAAIAQFLQTILSDSDLGSVNIEAGLSLVWKKGTLDIVTPFSIFPVQSTEITAVKTITDLLAASCQTALTATAPDLPDADSGSMKIRLRLKISTKFPENGVTDRMLLEITAIDFPLA